ncbi:MAG: GNAT family N-acetyltransferase [Anaerolineaceae bacterium]|nr:GNAT family N-acetyltransferase [Anaerolineaceae bacterium]
MTSIQTERLTLLPLSFEQLKYCLSNLKLLENDLGIHLAEGIIDEPVRCAIEIKIKKMKETTADQHLWYTYWLIVEKTGDIGIGSLGFKGEPNPLGSVEIGYGITPEYRKKGYMTEAVMAILDWAFMHKNCREVRADHVLKTNTASQKVLEKTRFKIIKETEEEQFWILRKSDYSSRK